MLVADLNPGGASRRVVSSTMFRYLNPSIAIAGLNPSDSDRGLNLSLLWSSLNPGSAMLD